MVDWELRILGKEEYKLRFSPQTRRMLLPLHVVTANYTENHQDAGQTFLR